MTFMGVTRTTTTKEHVGLTLSWVGIAALVAVLVPDIESAISLIGSVTGLFLAVFFPMYIKVKTSE